MQWTVTGADIQTGRERSVYVDCPTEAVAMRTARYMGLRVFSAQRTQTDHSFSHEGSGDADTTYYRNADVVVDRNSIRSGQYVLPISKIVSVRSNRVQGSGRFFHYYLCAFMASFICVVGAVSGDHFYNPGWMLFGSIFFCVVGFYLLSLGRHPSRFEVLISILGTDGFSANFDDAFAARIFFDLISDLVAGSDPEDAHHLPYHNVSLKQLRAETRGWFVIWW